MSMIEVLDEVVSVDFCTGFPVDVKVSLEDAITNPVVSHVNSFFLFFGRIIRNAGSAFVICLERCRWLRVAEIIEDGPYCFDFLCIVEEGSKFGFGGGGKSILHDGGQNKYGSVDWGDGLGMGEIIKFFGAQLKKSNLLLVSAL